MPYQSSRHVSRKLIVRFMLDRRRRRRPNINQTMSQRPIFVNAKRPIILVLYSLIKVPRRGVHGIKRPAHTTYPANTRIDANGRLMLRLCRRRWTNIKPASIQCIVFSAWKAFALYGYANSAWNNNMQMDARHINHQTPTSNYRLLLTLCRGAHVYYMIPFQSLNCNLKVTVAAGTESLECWHNVADALPTSRLL